MMAKKKARTTKGITLEHLLKQLQKAEKVQRRTTKYLHSTEVMIMEEIRDVRNELRIEIFERTSILKSALRLDIQRIEHKIDHNHIETMQKIDTIQQFIVRFDAERLPERVMALEARAAA